MNDQPEPRASSPGEIPAFIGMMEDTLDVLAVLFNGTLDGSPLRLPQIYEAVCRSRRSRGQADPGLRSIADTLRAGVAHGLFTQQEDAEGAGRPASRAGGSRRKPGAGGGYRPAGSPGELAAPLLKRIADSVPAVERHLLLLDLAKVIELPDDLVAQLRAMLSSR